MSYILDALRKSERQRRLGQPPDLDSVPGSDESGKPAGPGRLRWTLGAGFLVLLVAALGIYGFNKLGGFGAVDQPQVVEQIEVAPLESPAQPAPEPAEPDADQNPEAAQAGQRRTRTMADRRSPTQQPVTSISRPAPARPGAVTTPPPVVPDGERERLVTDAERAMQLIEERSAVAARKSVAPGQATDRAGETDLNPANPSEPGWTPERTDYVEVWELPLAVRRELPELHLSIHVFSTEPAERFVLINGERRREGESLGEGARLAEISRRGAVVDFRDYRFLLQP